MIYARIAGTGSYLPEKILSNEALEKTVDTTDAWITERTGIKSRRIAADHETVCSLGAHAALQAMDMAGITAAEIDMVLVATCTPAQIFPSTACLIQNALKIPQGPAFDLQAACSGFIYALTVAEQFIRSATVKKVLIVGTEIMSRVLDWQDRSTCILFGDGAGAVILEASESPGIIASHLGADGSQHDLLYLNNVMAAAKDAPEPLSPYVFMQGNKTFRSAVSVLKTIAAEMLAQHQLTIADIDWLVPHQANIRIIQATAEKLGLSMDKVIVTLAEQGNTSSASIPLALDYAIRSKKITRGQTLLLEAFGGGLTWGSTLVRY